LIDVFNTKKTNYQFDFMLPTGYPEQSKFMRARTSVILDKNGEKTGIVTIFSDVTLEREIDRVKTEFISTAAHELRTPLTSIVGFSQILSTREDLSEEEKKRFLSYIYKQGDHLANIVGDLLDICRIESGKGFELNKSVCDVREVIEEVIPYFQGITLEHEFEVDLPDRPVELLIDRDKIDQLMKNILSNAVKYSPKGGKIRISGKVIKNDLQVSVEDHGIGMTPEQVEKVFDKFYRADASDSAPEGTGLGMVIVKHIVESHGGSVWVESEFGKGTTVRFTLPIHSNNKGNK
ncbi:sensor histidine kinase, partial [Candidatus Latescibacterota bacterium]